MSGAENSAAITALPGKRLAYLDNAKGAGMLMIMLGHLSYLDEPVFSLCAAVKIVIFYIVSGYIFGIKQGGELSKKEYLKKRVRAIGIPYMIYSLMAIAADLAYALAAGADTAQLLKKDAIYTVTMRGVSTLWFLPTLLLADVLFVCLQNNISKIKYPLLITFLLLAYPLCKAYSLAKPPLGDMGIVGTAAGCILLVLLKSIVAFAFVVFGYVLYSALKTYSGKKYMWVVALLTTALAAVLSLINKGVDFNRFSLGAYPPLYIINGFLGGGLLIFVLIKLDGKIPMRLLSFVGRHSLFIMATHLPLKICYVIKRISRRIYNAKSAGLLYYCELAVGLLALLAVEYLLIKLVKAFKDKLPENSRGRKILEYI